MLKMKLFKNTSSGTKDLTEGKPMQLILSFGLPLLFGLIFQQLYNMVDSIIVGQVLGVNALAAVGSTSSINFMIMGFCIGVCNGFAIPVAQAFGAKDTTNLKRYITNCVWVSIIFATIFTTVVCLLTKDILIMMKTPDTIFQDAYTYILIIFLGTPAILLYNMVSGILRSMGNSVIPVIFLVFSSLLNIVLDLLMIKPMGVAGAAIATITAQGIAGIICLFYFIKKYSYLHFKNEDWIIRKIHVLKLCGIGIPMGLQYSVTGIGSVILQTSINALGETVVAAVTAANRIGIFATCPYEAMGTTMATYSGQNVGAGKLDRIDQGLKDCLKLGIGYGLIIFLIMVSFGKQFALLFVDADEIYIIELIYKFLCGSSMFYFLLAFVNTVRFTIQGLGYSTFAIIAGICEMIARSFSGVYLVPTFGFLLVPFEGPLAWLAADCFLIPAYLYVMKRLRRKLYQ